MNKEELVNEYKDGMIKYWSVFHQVWIQDPVDQVPVRELAAWTPQERERHAEEVAKAEDDPVWRDLEQEWEQMEENLLRESEARMRKYGIEH